MATPSGGSYSCEQRSDVERARDVTGAPVADFVVVARLLVTRKTLRAGTREGEREGADGAVGRRTRISDAKRYPETKRILSVTYAISRIYSQPLWHVWRGK